MKVIMLRGINADFASGHENSSSIHLKEGVKYIVPDYILAKIEEQIHPTRRNDYLRYNKDLYQEFVKYDGQDLTNRNLFILRTGGIGDLIFITPFAKHLKKKYPTSKIFLVCAEKNVGIFSGLSFFDGVLSIPLDYNEAIKSVGYPISRANTYLISFEGLIEHSLEVEKLNIYDLHKKWFGIVEDVEMKPEILFDEDLFKIVSAKYGFKEAKEREFIDIGFQFSASSPIRSWKPEYIVEFFEKWQVPNTRFFIFDSPYKDKFINSYLDRIKNPNITFIKVYETTKSVLESAYLVKHMQLVVVPDSSIAHFAGIFGIPIVGIFGAFHTDLRLSYYKNVMGINAMPNCGFVKNELRSCFAHGNICPRAEAVNRRFSPCMDIISPMLLLGYVYGFMEKLKIYNKFEQFK